MLKQLIDQVWSGGTSPQDSEIYALIHDELSSGAMDTGLWTKATAVSDGNTDKAKSRYIEMRANVLRNERKRLQEFAKRAQRQQLAIERQNAERERRFQELQSLSQREAAVQNKLWLQFTSPEAKKGKRKKQVRNTLIFAVVSVGSYLLLEEGGAIPIIVFGFGAWLLSLATYGKQELEDELKNVRRRINDLGGNT